MPFVTKVYFKPDTPGMMDWNIKVGERKGTVAKEIGTYQGKSSRAWEDELMVGDETSSSEHIYKSLLKDAEARVSEDAEIITEEDRVPVEQPMPRQTEADRTGDVKRLDRKLERTLYLVVKGTDDKWIFPSAPMGTEKNVHEVSYSRVRSDFRTTSRGEMIGLTRFTRPPEMSWIARPVLT